MNLLKGIFNEFFKVAWKWLIAGVLIGIAISYMILKWIATW